MTTHKQTKDLIRDLLGVKRLPAQMHIVTLSNAILQEVASKGHSEKTQPLVEVATLALTYVAICNEVRTQYIMQMGTAKTLEVFCKAVQGQVQNTTEFGKLFDYK